MPKFVVNVREVWINPTVIEAATEAEAIEAVSCGDGDSLGGEFEYSHTLDPDVWTIEKPDDERLEILGLL